MPIRRPSSSTGRAMRMPAAGWTTPSSRTTTSAALRLSTGRPRASVATRSMRTATVCGLAAVERSGAALWASASAMARAMRRMPRSAGDAEPDEILRFAAAVNGRLDFNHVLAGRQRAQRQLELLLAGRRRGRRGNLGHRLAGAVQQVDLYVRCGRAGRVGG